MNDEQDSSSNEQVKDVLQGEQNETQTPDEGGNSNTDEIASDTESNKSFQEKLDEFEAGERDENPWKEVPDWKIFSGFATVGLGGVLCAILIMTGSPGWGIVTLSLFIAAPLVMTKGGRAFLKKTQEEIQEANQYQQGSTNTKKSQVCSACGWQNPHSNSFCHDCGSELGNEE